MLNDEYLKYRKYKNKYLKLKKINMIGGNNLDYQIDQHIININKILDNIEKTINNKEILKNDLEKLIIKLNNYFESSDIPLYNYLNLLNFDFNNLNLEILNDLILKLKESLTYENLLKLYNLRNEIYSLNDNNYNEILDTIIKTYSIINIENIENIFLSGILGYNKNYVIGFMVLFRLLLLDKNLIYNLNNNISFLREFNIWNSLSSEKNLDDYLLIIIKQINEYIMSNPIKKVILIKNNYPIVSNDNNDEIYSYDVKNKIIIYKTGDNKDIIKINYNDLKQIINSLLKIPIKKI